MFAATRYNSLEDRRWLPYRNDSAETVPPFGVLRLTGRATSGSGNNQVSFLTADKPDSDTEADPLSGLVAINGPLSVAAGGYGQCTQDWPAQVRQNGTTSTTGDEIGPVDGEWYFDATGKGFSRISSGITLASGVVAVWASPKGGDGVRLAKLTATASAASTDQVVSVAAQLYDWSPASSPATIGINGLSAITAWNPHDVSIPSGTLVMVAKTPTGWLIVTPVNWCPA